MNPITDLEHYEYVGALHIHSRYSDGTGTVERIIKAAVKAELDYIVITDHNTLQAMENGSEGWHGDLLVLVGEEIGKHGGDHYLAFGISKAIKPEDHQQNARYYIKSVKSQSGIGFAAHPSGLDNASFDLRLSPWSAWDDTDYTGLEIWAYMSDWGESVTRLNIIYYYFRPEKTINGPPPDLLRKWDQLCQMRRVVGIGGSDVHALHRSPFNFVKFLSYKRAFRGIRTHIITPSPLGSDLDGTKKLVYAALGSGHCFFAHDFLAASRGFDFVALMGENRMLLMGDAAEWESGIELQATSPVPAYMRLLQNGKPVKEAAEIRQLTWKANEPGVYRVEARYRDAPWVFTNPIYLRESIGQ